MAAGRNATSTRWASPAQNPRERRRSKASKRGISSKQLSPAAANKASTLDGFWSGQVDHLTSERNRAEYRGSAIASVLRFIDAMAIATGKERAIPPRSKDEGLPGPISVKGLCHSVFLVIECSSRRLKLCRLLV